MNQISILNYTFYILAVVLVIWGCYSDIRTKTIPIWCTFPLFLLGIIKNVLNEGWMGIVYSLLGAIGLVALFGLLLVFHTNGVGGGDLKLIMAIGAFGGIHNLSVLLVVEFFFSGIMMLIYLAIKEKAYNPLTFAKTLWTEWKLEKMKAAETTQLVLGPFIGVPFILYLVINSILIGVV